MYPSLTAVHWAAFDPNIILEFSNDDPEDLQIILQLNDIHILTSRQSLLGGPIRNYPEERFVRYFNIREDSPFFQESCSLYDKVEDCGKMYVYDTHNRPMDDVNFTKPLHVNVNSDDGILDIVCESITELEGTNKGFRYIAGQE